MDQQNGPGQAWDLNNAPSNEVGGNTVTQQAADQYVPYGHQLPDHGAPDPVESAPAYSISSSVSPTAAPPEPPVAAASMAMPADDRPVPVVKVLSVRGIEYAMMSILLWFSSASLIIILVSLVMGSAGFDALAFPVSVLIIGVPLFALFYIRLRRAELRDPSLRLEASKRRFSQITQILAFLTCFFNLITLVYTLVGMAGGKTVDSIGKLIGAAAVILLVAGGILAYYWFDEHKLAKR